MKIEKISEDKIRIILKQEDFRDKSINVQKLLLVTPESQKLFLELLDKVKKEINFDTDGHKLLIEAYFQNDDSYIFTITKYIDKNSSIYNHQKKCLTAKKKTQIISSSSIYLFNNFDDFCALCNFLKYNNIRGIFKSSILYFYNNKYYLIINDINPSNDFIYYFNSSLLEFSNSLSFTENFEYKLKEHGKVIIKNNAILTGIKYFANK